MSQLDRLLGVVMMGSKGNTQAHWFISDFSGRNVRPEDVQYHLKGRYTGKTYIPPKAEDRVLCFQDGSGVYLHSDGFITPMGNDIRHELPQFTLVS